MAAIEVLKYAHSPAHKAIVTKDYASLRRILTALLLSLRSLPHKRHFLWNRRPIRYDLFHMILHSIWLSRLSQIQIPES
ncbi:hypothetical protein RchiOBHm_Chr2g0107541 [Rosa chinensis]|uniref:Uncharacterized protein n=1 Tax=Rosa chinensis TaxID=74649 RepID=A0A2P6RNZ6_ROSCH|nr:hypothetical protein RchiOBHm_Chr2g0107541 [Rosa chinensis]